MAFSLRIPIAESRPDRNAARFCMSLVLGTRARKRQHFILAALDVATEPADVSLPAFSLRSLQGELKEMVFAPLSISATDAAERLSMCRPALSRVLIIQAAAV